MPSRGQEMLAAIKTLANLQLVVLVAFACLCEACRGCQTARKFKQVGSRRPLAFVELQRAQRGRPPRLVRYPSGRWREAGQRAEGDPLGAEGWGPLVSAAAELGQSAEERGARRNHVGQRRAGVPAVLRGAGHLGPELPALQMWLPGETRRPRRKQLARPKTFGAYRARGAAGASSATPGAPPAGLPGS